MITRLFFTTLFVISCACLGTSQERPRAPRLDRGLISTHADSIAHITRIITTTPFQGKNYFIMIVPIDSGNVYKMPIYNPNRPRPMLWKDSLQRLLPDTVLRFLPNGPDFK
jgi:hypothetical protein